MNAVRLAVAGLVLYGAGVGASAQTPTGFGGLPSLEGRSVYGGPLAPPRFCEKLCERDTSPCDPPNFKQADGRCSPFEFTR